MPKEKPLFLTYKPQFDLLEQMAGKYKNYKNILVIGHGGSINSFYGVYNALIELTDKKAYFLNTTDPDYINRLKKELNPKDTLVIPISKSGETVTLLEALAQFADFPLLFIAGRDSALWEIAKKMNADVVPHPAIGGRFNGVTEITLLPAALVGLNIKKLFDGAGKFYQMYDVDNLAFKAASVFWQLEQKGFVDVFMPFYSHNLFYMSNIIVQLCHESFGKNGMGQTYFAHEAPESQHHTNQRFFGGKKNIAGFFVGTDSFLYPTQNSMPAAIHSVQIKNHALFDLNNIPLEVSMDSELHGTLEDAKINSIPAAHLSISGFSENEIGNLMAFWQLYAVYSSLLRKVDPFDQPQVENSKVISFNKRLKYKNLI